MQFFGDVPKKMTNAVELMLPVKGNGIAFSNIEVGALGWISKDLFNFINVFKDVLRCATKVFHFKSFKLKFVFLLLFG